MMKALLPLPFLALAFAAACGHDDHEDGEHGPGGHTSPYASCQAIIDACHPKDIGEGPAHDCHDRAHAPTASEAVCAAEKTTCLSTCASTDSGAVTGHTSPHPSCQDIINVCHPKDVGDGPIHDCHDVAANAASTEATCVAKKAECTATCSADAGPT